MDKILIGLLAFLLVKLFVGSKLEDKIKEKVDSWSEDEGSSGGSDKPKGQAGITMQRRIEEIEKIVAANVPAAEFAKNRQALRLGLHEILRGAETGAISSLTSDAQRANFLTQKVPALRGSNIA
jgi:hypothetical protein